MRRSCSHRCAAARTAAATAAAALAAAVLTAWPAVVTGAGAAGPAPPFPWIVDIRQDLLDDGRVRLSTVAGLLNRWGPRAVAKVGWGGFDHWQPVIEATRGLKFTVVNRSAFYSLARAVAPSDIARKVVYSWADRDAVLPTVVTLCGMLDAVAVAAEFDDAPELECVANVTGRWRSHEVAALYLLDIRNSGAMPAATANSTTMMLQDPSLLAQGFMVDLVVAERQWAFWFDNMMPGTINPDCSNVTNKIGQAIFIDIVDGATAPKGDFITLMGYYGTRGKDEVPGHCTPTHRQVTLASDLASSLSFFKQLGARPPQGGYKQVPQKPMVFDPEKAYVAIVTSDGDNLAYDYGQIMYMLDGRIASCQAANRTARDCPPMTWTVSPRALEFAPVWLEYFYRRAHESGAEADTFLFGPSGYGYLYPAQLSVELQGAFAAKTVAAAAELDIVATVVSENPVWADMAERVEQLAFYGGTRVRGIVTEVWDGPAVVGNLSVVATDVPGYDPYHVIPLDVNYTLAAINALPRGSITHATLIVQQAQVPLIVEVARGAAPHVEFVGHREMFDLLRQKCAGNFSAACPLGALGAEVGGGDLAAARRERMRRRSEHESHVQARTAAGLR